MNKRMNKGRLGLAVLFQLLLAAGLTMPALLGRLQATPIVLETAPVDPRDLLRGHYLTLRYAVSQVKTGGESWRRGQTVYVPLNQVGDVWQAKGVQAQPPQEGLFLRGKVEWQNGPNVILNYGIERYYLSQDTAKGQNNMAKLRARVLVSKGGKAYLQSVEQGGVTLR